MGRETYNFPLFLIGPHAFELLICQRRGTFDGPLNKPVMPDTPEKWNDPVAENGAFEFGTLAQ